jgi:hypothetical protein
MNPILHRGTIYDQPERVEFINTEEVMPDHQPHSLTQYCDYSRGLSGRHSHRPVYTGCAILMSRFDLTDHQEV